MIQVRPTVQPRPPLFERTAAATFQLVDPPLAVRTTRAAFLKETDKNVRQGSIFDSESVARLRVALVDQSVDRVADILARAAAIDFAMTLQKDDPDMSTAGIVAKPVPLHDFLTRVDWSGLAATASMTSYANIEAVEEMMGRLFPYPEAQEAMVIRGQHGNLPFSAMIESLMSFLRPYAPHQLIHYEGDHSQPTAIWLPPTSCFNLLAEIRGDPFGGCPVCGIVPDPVLNALQAAGYRAEAHGTQYESFDDIETAAPLLLLWHDRDHRRAFQSAPLWMVSVMAMWSEACFENPLISDHDLEVFGAIDYLDAPIRKHLPTTTPADADSLRNWIRGEPHRRQHLTTMLRDFAHRVAHGPYLATPPSDTLVSYYQALMTLTNELSARNAPVST